MIYIAIVSGLMTQLGLIASAKCIAAIIVYNRDHINSDDEKLTIKDLWLNSIIQTWLETLAFISIFVVNLCCNL